MNETEKTDSRSLHALVMARDVAGAEALLRERNGSFTFSLATSINSITYLLTQIV